MTVDETDEVAEELIEVDAVVVAVKDCVVVAVILAVLVPLEVADKLPLVLTVEDTEVD